MSFNPNWTVSPWRTILETFEHYFKEDKEITPEMAEHLEKLVPYKKDFILRFEEGYRKDLQEGKVDSYREELLSNSNKPNQKNMSIQEASELLGKSQQFVRVGLQRAILPFGYAVKLSSRWTYHISPTKFYEYTIGKEE